MNNKFYITTAIPYVNAAPHIGHAFEFVLADAIARYHRLIGDSTLFLSGADENALKNVQAAEKEGILVQELVNKNSKLFEDLAKKLNVNFDVFQRGSSPQHHESSQQLWKACEKDIYKKAYTGLYCVGCEQFYEKEDLNENQECFEHPGKKLEEVSEENYFFKLSKYQNQLIEIVESDKLQIIPAHRKNEILVFLKKGLKDISVSRSNERAKNWGVKVPDDETQRIYVWFDALNIYRSGVENKTNKNWWPADVHTLGKGITRFHAVYWPAFLLSAGIELPRKIFVHEYITVNGQKMSKTTGNIVDPIPLIEKYGADALRYYLLAKISPFSDGDFTEEKLKQAYNADLANGLGNLVARVARLCEKINFKAETKTYSFDTDTKKYLEEFKLNEVVSKIWILINEVNQRINAKEPWKLSGTDLETELKFYTDSILNIAFNLQSFLPETAKKIQKQFAGEKITSQKPLFPRI